MTTEYHFPGRPTPASDNPELYDHSLLLQAIQCAAAADAYTIATRGGDWFVHFLLIGTGTECALKAFGISRGATEKQLRAWGHNLTRALAFAEQNGLPLTLSDQQRTGITTLSERHTSKVTTYPLVKGYAIPQPRVIREALDEIIRATFISIWGPGQFEHDREHTLGLSIARGA